jgi:pimeloyl-ACP methyl ester carboxylesterase
MYVVNGRTLAMDKVGTGPSVVFLPGAGLVGRDFWNIHDRLAPYATSVLYDRGGTGWSAPVDLPRSAREVATELHDLLTTAGMEGPHVLVGHSIGAVYARRFAQLFPGDVAGLLLADPGHEDMFDFLPPDAREMNERMKPDPATMPDLTPEQIDAARAAYAGLYAAWPAEIRQELIDYHVTRWRTALYETANLESEVYDELRHGGPVPDVPVLVLSATARNPYWANFLTEEQMTVAHDGIRTLHASIAAGSSRGEHRLLDGASHQHLHIEQPDAVVHAVLDVLARVAEPGA